MKLKNGTIRPGIVIEVLDKGCIKAGVPGLFNREDKDKLPPIMPFPFGHNVNSFSSIKELEEVWIMNFSDNPMQLYWVRKDNMAENNKELLKEENVEIICNRENDLTWATIYFSDGSGWIIRNDESVVQIRKDGSILLDSNLPHRVIDINPKSISLGSKTESAHPAVYGDVLMEALQNIQISLELIKQASNMNPYTKPISIGLGKLPSELKELIPKVVSTNVTLD